MSTKQMARLTALAAQRAERRLRELTQTRLEVDRLLQQHDELVAFANSYEAVRSGPQITLPAILGVRRQFVSGVLAEAEKLRPRIEELRALMVERQARHQRTAAEALALEGLLERAVQEEGREAMRQERNRLDELSGRSGFGTRRPRQGD